MPRLKNIDRSSAIIASIAIVTAIASAFVPVRQKHGEKSHSHAAEKQDAHSESGSEGEDGGSSGASHSHSY